MSILSNWRLNYWTQHWNFILDTTCKTSCCMELCFHTLMLLASFSSGIGKYICVTDPGQRQTSLSRPDFRHQTSDREIFSNGDWLNPYRFRLGPVSSIDSGSSPPKYPVYYNYTCFHTNNSRLFANDVIFFPGLEPTITWSRRNRANCEAVSWWPTRLLTQKITIIWQRDKDCGKMKQSLKHTVFHGVHFLR